MSKSVVNIIDFPVLYNVLFEVKDFLNFEVVNYENEDVFLEKIEKENSIKNYTIVTKKFLNNKNINQKNIIYLDNAPINFISLIDKINTNLLKQRFSFQSNINIKNYSLNLNSRVISRNENELKLTEREIEIIIFLKNSNSPQNIENLQKKVWGHNSDLETHTVETHIYRLRKKIRSNFADENFNLFGRVQRTFGKVRASLRTNFNYSKINQFIQNQRSINEGFTQVYTPEIRTNFRVAPNISLQYRYSISNNIQGTRETKFITKAPSIDFDAYIIEKFTFKTNYSYNIQEQVGGESQSFQLWDFSLAYRKDKDAKWEYELKASNILNISSRIQNSANSVSVLNSSTFIQPRFLTFRIIYKL